MRVVEVETQDHQKRYVVIDDTGEIVDPIVRYLKYLDRLGSARQTLRSYASALRLYWDFLGQQHLDWQQVTLDDLSQFVLWLKMPSGSLKVLPVQPVEQARSNRTINHALTVVRGFYDYHWRLTECQRENNNILTRSYSEIQTFTPSHHKWVTSCEKYPQTKGRETTTPINHH